MAELSTLVAPLVGVMKDYNMKGFPEDYAHPQKIPLVEFIPEDIAAYVKSHGGVAQAQQKVDKVFSLYKLSESKMTQSKESLHAKIPEITKTIQAVKHLKAKDDDEELTTHFELADVVYAEGKVKEKIERVGLWLGANVMVEYTLDEATELLSKNLKIAIASLEQILEDLAWVTTQINICEVNFNRLHNYRVQERRELREREAKQ
ncbi:putative prefoldin subunit 3 [Diplonema papillatum]|nr:putative prefoldin subunit 3 [Diplonema papillatum]